MINLRIKKSICCEDISLIENYNQAIADETQTWICHHRLETDLNLTVQELKDQNKYYNVPASELIFLTHDAHNKLHKCGKKQSDETKKKISESHKGHVLKEETRKKLSELRKGKPSWNKGKHNIYSKETLNIMSISHKGKHRVYREDGTFYME